MYFKQRFYYSGVNVFDIGCTFKLESV